MKPERMNLKYLLIIWINYDFRMSGEDTRQERGKSKGHPPGGWQLSKNDLDYYYSSARFYETGIDEFGFLKNIFEIL